MFCRREFSAFSWGCSRLENNIPKCLLCSLRPTNCTGSGEQCVLWPTKCRGLWLFVEQQSQQKSGATLARNCTACRRLRRDHFQVMRFRKRRARLSIVNGGWNGEETLQNNQILSASRECLKKFQETWRPPCSIVFNQLLHTLQNPNNSKVDH